MNGKLTLKIPEGTQSGKIFRLRGKGIKSLRTSNMGDLYVHPAVETPVNLTDEQKEILRNFEATLTKSKRSHHAPEKKGFFDKIGDLFK